MKRLLLTLLLLVGCGRLDYDAVNIHEPIIVGGQREIDQGYAVDVIGLDPEIWIAGHRTTNGAVFRNLPNAKIGDRVCVHGKCYTVVNVFYWPSHDKPPSSMTGTLVLQTSLPGGVLLVVAE